MKKIKFIESWENYPGHTIKAGQTASVSTRKANELIESGVAQIYKELPLPADLPARKLLLKAGYKTIDQIRKIENFTEVNGIGEATAKEIIEFLKTK